MSSSILKDKVAIVTGGNGGIGLGISEGFAEEGAKVIVAARNEEKNKAAIEKIKKISQNSETFNLDVNDQDSINKLMEFTIEKFGKIDILVNNAGISRRSDEPHLLAKSDWDDVIDTNLNSIHHMTSAVFPHLKKNKSGKIINIGSMMSIFGNANSAAYAASKGGVVQYTKSCAIAWAKYNIQINTILPGWIVTDMTNEFKKVNPKRYATIAGRTPAERWGLPEDMAGTAIFLSSKFSDFVNGVSIPVDGGYSVM